MRVFTPSVDIPRTGLFELRVAVSWDKEIEILYKDRMEEIVNSAFNILLFCSKPILILNKSNFE